MPKKGRVYFQELWYISRKYTHLACSTGCVCMQWFYKVSLSICSNSKWCLPWFVSPSSCTVLLLLCFLGREKHLWFYNLSCTKLSCLRQPPYCMFNTELCTVAILKLNSGCWCLQQNLGGINDSWLIVQEKISPFVQLTPFSTNGSEAILWYKTKQLEMH